MCSVLKTDRLHYAVTLSDLLSICFEQIDTAVVKNKLGSEESGELLLLPKRAVEQPVETRALSRRARICSDDVAETGPVESGGSGVCYYGSSLFLSDDAPIIMNM